MMNPELLCLVCTDSMDNNISSVLECNCHICVNCLSGWITYHAQEHFITGDKLVRCPNESCDRKYPLDSLLPRLPRAQSEQISELLLRNYVHEAPDVVNCQRGSCKYSGVLTSESCSNDLICELCGHKWKERSQMTPLEKAFYALMNLSTAVSEIQTAVYHFFYTVQCPRCSIPIRKVGGCAHMVCKKCSHEFCWECKQEFMYHSKNHCIAHQFATKCAIGFVFFYLGILMGIYITFWNLWLATLKLILKLCLLNSAFLVLFLLIYPILRIIKEEESIFQDRLKSIWYVSWFSIMAYITYWHMHYLLYNYLEELIWATCVETLLVWLVRGIDYLVQTWLKYVF